MAILLISNGFQANYIYWDISFFEFQYLFLGLIKIKLRTLQQASGLLIGSVATLFAKENSKTYIDMLENQINSINTINTEFKEVEKKRTKVDFSSLISILKRK